MNPEQIAKAGAHLLSTCEVWPHGASTTRDSIVTAALKTFASRGYHGSALKDITAGIGLSTAALYVHFASKEELLFEISRRGHEAALEVVKKCAESDLDTGATLSLLVYTFTRWHAEQRTLAYVVQHEWVALSPGHIRVIQTIRDQIQTTFRGVLIRGVEARTLDVPDIRSASAAILSMCIDVGRWYRPEGPYTPDGLGQKYAELMSKLLAPAAAPSVPMGH